MTLSEAIGAFALGVIQGFAAAAGVILLLCLLGAVITFVRRCIDV